MSSALTAIASLLVITLCYVAVCVVSPFGTCRTCRGLGFKLKTDRKGRPKRGKDCRRCKRTGKRIRVGRHLFNLWLRAYRPGRAADPAADMAALTDYRR